MLPRPFSSTSEEHSISQIIFSAPSERTLQDLSEAVNASNLSAARFRPQQEITDSNMSQSTVPPVSLDFVDMDLWVKEQETKEALEVTLKNENAKPAVAPPAPKKIKPLVDIEAIAQEQLAIEELGNDNWIGRLQRKPILPVIHIWMFN